MTDADSSEELYRFVNVAALLLTLILMAATVELAKVAGWSRPFALTVIAVAVMVYLPVSWAVCSSAVTRVHRFVGGGTDG